MRAAQECGSAFSLLDWKVPNRVDLPLKPRQRCLPGRLLPFVTALVTLVDKILG